MILKIKVTRRDSEQPCWRWIDQVRDVETYGQLVVPVADEELIEGGTITVGALATDGDRILPADGRPAIGLFTSWDALQKAVTHNWGPHGVRSFDDEVWPTIEPTPAAPYAVEAVVARHRDNRRTFVLLGFTEAFLLDDSGNTIERLR